MPLLVGVSVAIALGTGPAFSVGATVGVAPVATGHQEDRRGSQAGVGTDVAWGDDDTRQSSRAVKNGYWRADDDLGSLYSLSARPRPGGRGSPAAASPSP